MEQIDYSSSFFLIDPYIWGARHLGAAFGPKVEWQGRVVHLLVGLLELIPLLNYIVAIFDRMLLQQERPFDHFVAGCGYSLSALRERGVTSMDDLERLDVFYMERVVAPKRGEGLVRDLEEISTAAIERVKASAPPARLRWLRARNEEGAQAGFDGEIRQWAAEIRQIIEKAQALGPEWGESELEQVATAEATLQQKRSWQQNWDLVRRMQTIIDAFSSSWQRARLDAYVNQVYGVLFWRWQAEAGGAATVAALDPGVNLFELGYLVPLNWQSAAAVAAQIEADAALAAQLATEEN